MSTSPPPPIKLALGKSVVSVELNDLVNNQRIATFSRTGSRCTFAESISHPPYELTLRLDWGDLAEGEPTLDVDVLVVHPDGTRSQLKPKKIPVHHVSLGTLSPNSTAPRTYDLVYKGLHMRLVARKTFAVGIGLSVNIVDPVRDAAAPDRG